MKHEIGYPFLWYSITHLEDRKMCQIDKIGKSVITLSP